MPEMRQTPQSDAEETLLKYIHIVAGMTTNSLAGYLLEHGGFWTPQRLPDKFAVDKVGECYKNAALLAFNPYHEGEWTYCEGYGLALIPTEHAWCIDKLGRVIDTTWRTRRGKYKHDPSELAYFGITYTTEELRLKLVRTNTFGMTSDWMHYDVVRDILSRREAVPAAQGDATSA